MVYFKPIVFLSTGLLHSLQKCVWVHCQGGDGAQQGGGGRRWRGVSHLWSFSEWLWYSKPALCPSNKNKSFSHWRGIFLYADSLSPFPRWCTSFMATGRASARARTLPGRRNTTRGRPPTAGRKGPWRRRTRRPERRPERSATSSSGNSWPLSANVTGVFRLTGSWWRSRTPRRPKRRRRWGGSRNSARPSEPWNRRLNMTYFVECWTWLCFLPSPKTGRGIQRAELDSHVWAGEGAATDGGAVWTGVWRCIRERRGREQRRGRSVRLLDVMFRFPILGQSLFFISAKLFSFCLCVISFISKY